MGSPQQGMQAPSPFSPPPPFGGAPFTGGAPFSGGNSFMSPSGPPMAPFNPTPPMTNPGGLGGMLQGLLGGGGGAGLNLPGLLANAQKVIGAINQAGDVFKNIGPMLQLLQGFNSSDLLADDESTEIEDQEKSKPRKKKKRNRKQKRKNKSVRRKAKKRSN